MSLFFVTVLRMWNSISNVDALIFSGCVWVYGNYSSVQYHESQENSTSGNVTSVPYQENYCDKTCYNFAFSILTIIWIVLAISLPICCKFMKLYLCYSCMYCGPCLCRGGLVTIYEEFIIVNW